MSAPKPIPRGPRSIVEMAARLLHQRRDGGWEFVFGTPDRVRDWHIYAYEYIDDLNWMPPAAELFRDWELGDELIARVAERFREIGWEGDGEFQVFWLPPFLGVGVRDYGCYGLLVKQDNDGTSWLASPVPLPWCETVWDTHPIYEEFMQRGIEDGRLARLETFEEVDEVDRDALDNDGMFKKQNTEE